MLYNDVVSLVRQGLTVWFLLLRYSVVCTVESLSLFYLLFICQFVCTRRRCIDELSLFHANQHLCILIYIRNKGKVGTLNMFKTFRYFTDRFMAVLLLWIFFAIYVSRLSLLYMYCLVCSLQLCDHLLGKGWSFGSLVCNVSMCFVCFPYDVLGQLWYLIVSISDLCLLLYLYHNCNLCLFCRVWNKFAMPIGVILSYSMYDIETTPRSSTRTRLQFYYT